MPNYPIFQVGSYVLDDTNGVYLQETDADSSTPLTLDTFTVARKNGGKLVSATYSPKKIMLAGTVIGSSYADLTTKLDNFKSHCIGTGLFLDIDDGTICKRYTINTNGSATLDRKGGVIHAAFKIVYDVIDPPYGVLATRGGAVTTLTAMNDSNVTVDIYTYNNQTVTFGGTAEPATKITVTVTTPGDLSTLEFVDVTNSRTLAISPATAIQSGDTIVIDTGVPTVTLNNDVVPFTGLFPVWQPQTASSIAVYAYTTTGLILDQYQKSSNSQQIIFRPNTILAQKFTTGSTAGSFPRFQITANKVGNPTGTINLSVVADSAGTPGTTVVVPVVSIPAASVSSTFTLLTASVATLPNFTASTVYWLLVTVSGSGTDVNNYYQIRTYTNIPKGYANGGLSKSTDTGTTYNSVTNTDLAFKTYRSVQGQKNDIVEQDNYIENFNTTTFKDAANTTAKWDTTYARIIMNGVKTLDQSDISWSGSYSAFMNSGTYYTGAGNAWAQSFIPTITGSISEIDLPLYIGNASNAPAGAGVTVSVYSNNGSTSLPYGDITGGGTFVTNASMGLGSAAAYRSFNFSPGQVAVIAGVTYWIIAQCNTTQTNSSESGVSWFGSSVDSYVNGRAVQQNNNAPFGTTSPGVADFGFRVYVSTYSTTEYAQSLQINSSTADILTINTSSPSVSIPGGGSITDYITTDGSTFQTIPLVTNTIPTLNGNILKWKSALIGNVTAPTMRNALWNVSYNVGVAINATTIRGAQSFVQPTTGSILRVDLYGTFIGSPGSLTVRLETDTAGSPSGTLVTGSATTTISSASYTAGSFGWLSANFGSSVAVTSGTTYWIVAYASATLDNADKWLLQANNGRYSGGATKKSTNSGTSYSVFASGEELLFRTYGSNGNNFAYNVAITYLERFL